MGSTGSMMCVSASKMRYPARAMGPPPSGPSHHVDEGRLALVLDHAQGASKGGPDCVGAIDRALGPDSEALGDPREIRRGVVDADPHDLVLDRPRSRLGDDLLMRLV